MTSTRLKLQQTCSAIGLMAMAAAISATTALAAPPDAKPAAAAWVDKPLDKWPGILLQNRVILPTNAGGYYGGSSLARLPNGVIVLMTAGHLLGEVKPGDFKTGFKSWNAVASPTAVTGLRMTSIAMDTTKPLAQDIVVMLSAMQQGPWPSTVLEAREEPLTIGETLYLVGQPDSPKERQIVRRAEVAKLRGDGAVEYTVEGKFETKGNSGAPVIDSKGRLAGVNTGHLDNQTVEGKMQLVLVEAAAILPEIQLPKTMKPLVLTTQPLKLGPKTDAESAAEATEAEADKALFAIEAMKGQPMMKPELEKAMLEDLVEKYPGTTAAKKAKAKLATLK